MMKTINDKCSSVEELLEKCGVERRRG